MSFCLTVDGCKESQRQAMLSAFLLCHPDNRGPQQAAGVLPHSEHSLQQSSSMEPFTLLQPLIEHLLRSMYFQGSKTLKFFICLKKYHRCLQGNKDGVAHPLLRRTHQAVASRRHRHSPATGISARVHLLFNCYPQVTSLGLDCQEVSSGYRKEGLACFFILE